MRSLFSFVVSLGLGVDEFQHPGTIRIVRRRDGLVLTEIDHHLPSELEAHAGSLRERLVSEDVAEFCRDLGISPEHVTGAGEDFVESELLAPGEPAPPGHRGEVGREYADEPIDVRHATKLEHGLRNDWIRPDPPTA